MIGRELDGRYRVVRKLGEGGMAEVYLAEHLGLHRPEALKILHPQLAEQQEFIARFRREARATNRLQHPNIVAVYDFGQLPDGRFYLTTEYVDGEPLSLVLMRSGALAVTRSLYLLAQLAEAIDHAHSRGVIHRDLKPSNLLLVEQRGRTDVLKVLDFGIAKIIAPDYEDSVGQTKQPHFFGTPSYMAPEQVRGEGADPRIDIYAAGCIAYELLTGQPPFTSTRQLDLMHMHVQTEPVAVRERVGGTTISGDLDAIVLRCLAKDPNHRFQTGRELVEALRGLPEFPSQRRTPNERRSSRSLRGYAAGPVIDDWEDLETNQSIGSRTQRISAAAADTMLGSGVDPTELPASRGAALRLAAEQLMNAGCKDLHLLMAHAQVSDVEEQAERLAEEAARLDEHADHLDQRSRSHENTLRFALGDLRFERDQVVQRGERLDPEVDIQIQELERRLSALTQQREQDLAKVMDRAVEVASQQADVTTQLDRTYATLESHVRRVAANAETPGLQQLLAFLDRG